MRWLFLGVLALASCAVSPIKQTRLPDGTLKVTCELAMDECVRRVQDHCPHLRYRILQATSETRLRDAPPFERAYHTSHLQLKCTNDGATEVLGPKSTGEEPAPAAPVKAQACGVGETRACVGPAGCQGGQACLPDSSGFGPCDCGTSTAAAPSAPPPVSTPEQPAPPAAPAP